MSRSDEALVEELRSAGLRATAPRVAVLTVLRRAPHSDTDTIIRRARAELGTVSTQAVYNVLAALVGAGLVRRIEPAGSVALYERRVGDNHHHLVCRRCGAVTDVDCAVGRRPCLAPADAHGFLLDEAEVTYWGTCPACRARSGPAVPPGSVEPGDRHVPPPTRAGEEGTARRDGRGSGTAHAGPRARRVTRSTPTGGRRTANDLPARPQEVRT